MVELLLIALLLLCNCLNLVSVLGFGALAPPTTSASATPALPVPFDAIDEQIDFEKWQLALIKVGAPTAAAAGDDSRSDDLNAGLDDDGAGFETVLSSVEEAISDDESRRGGHPSSSSEQQQ